MDSPNQTKRKMFDGTSSVSNAIDMTGNVTASVSPISFAKASSEKNDETGGWRDFSHSLTAFGAPVSSLSSSKNPKELILEEFADSQNTRADTPQASQTEQSLAIQQVNSRSDTVETTKLPSIIKPSPTDMSLSNSDASDVVEELSHGGVEISKDLNTVETTKRSSTIKPSPTDSSLSSSDESDVVEELSDGGVEISRDLSKIRASWHVVQNYEKPTRCYLITFVLSLTIAGAVMLIFILGSQNNNNTTASIEPTSTLSPTTTTSPSLSPTTSPSWNPTMTPRPTTSPSASPTAKPSTSPTYGPSDAPTLSLHPTSSPSEAPSWTPSSTPTSQPSTGPTNTPTLSASPTITSVPTSEPITYVPGKLTVESNGLQLSEGLASRVLARSGQKVLFTGNLNQQVKAWFSSISFHFKPDGAAAYAWQETGGWIYVSNSEVLDVGGGGVGAIYFDKDGKPVDYQRLINGTTANCSGGKTPWHTWVTCEEADSGKIYQVDPLGIREPQEMTIGREGGRWESFAYDIRNTHKPRFFATEDKETGALRRFTPDVVDWEDPWNILHANGTMDYLLLQPSNTTTREGGIFIWSNDLGAAKDNANLYYRHTEGIDVKDNHLFVVSKEQKELFILDLDAMTYEAHSTVFGLFDGQPDQMKRLIQDSDDDSTSLLYFCEEGGSMNGVHARDANGWYFTILESDNWGGETSGLAFSPDGRHMYFSYQHQGIVFDVWREDGQPFHGKTLSVKYHETGQL
jgi:hypothetical protein